MQRFRKNIKLYIGIATIGLISSCKPTIEVDEPNKAGVDFSKYIAVGNSLSAGFADGGLYLSGQQQAFPNMIAEKMKALGGGEFTSPFFDEAQSNGSGYIRLKALVNGQPVMENVTDKLAYTGAGVLAKYTGPFQNYGVPGMRLDHSGVGAVGLGNMYLARLLPAAEVGKTSYQDLVTKNEHTFFSFSLGNNDALGYAMNGAVNNNPSGTTVLTSVQTFTAVLNQFIGKLTAKGQKGVIATIPDVTTVPYFTTVTRQALLAAASAAAGTQLKDLYIATKTGTRAATDQDMFRLPFSSAGLLGKPNAMQIPYGLHPLNPIEDIWVLDVTEAKEVQDRVNQYNEVIKSVASSKNLAVADLHSFLFKIKGGYNYNGITISNKFITGNAFSLDGVHLTPMGYAIMGNIFIDAINAKYGTNLEKIDAAQYHAVLMP